MREKNALLILSVAITTILLMNIPRVLYYQGKLLNFTGIGVNGTLNITFKLNATCLEFNQRKERIVAKIFSPFKLGKFYNNSYFLYLATEPLY